jgi:F0F1-type ATP synthase membrane subunit c/vacuolar-type H+-ATPase subunit K
LFAVLVALAAFWCLVVFVVWHWPGIALGCLAAAVAAGAITTVSVRIVCRQRRADRLRGVKVRLG